MTRQPTTPIPPDEVETRVSEPRIKSVDKAITILDTLSRYPRGIALSRLAKDLSLRPSGLHHLLSTLQHRGLVEQDPETSKYRLGPYIAILGWRYAGHRDLYLESLPLVHALKDATGETAILSVLQGFSFVALLEVLGNHALVVRRDDTREGILHCTASGKVLLAHQSPTFAREYIERWGLTSKTRSTLVTEEDLLADLQAVRDRGYAFDHEEHIPGVSCVAAPVRDATGAVRASVSVAYPSVRSSPKAVDHYVASVLECAEEISHGMGYRDPSGAWHALRRPEQD